MAKISLDTLDRIDYFSERAEIVFKLFGFKWGGFPDECCPSKEEIREKLTTLVKEILETNVDGPRSIASGRLIVEYPFSGVRKEEFQYNLCFYLDIE